MGIWTMPKLRCAFTAALLTLVTSSITSAGTIHFFVQDPPRHEPTQREAAREPDVIPEVNEDAAQWMPSSPALAGDAANDSFPHDEPTLDRNPISVPLPFALPAALLTVPILLIFRRSLLINEGRIPGLR